MSRWEAPLAETNRCLYCEGSFVEQVNWTWTFGLSEEKLLCPDCEGKLIEIKEIGCEMCGRPVEKKGHEFVNSDVKLPARFVSKPTILCRDCVRWKEEAQGEGRSVQQRSLYVYNDYLQEVIARFKYRGDAKLATLFLKKLKVLARPLGKVDVVTVVPLSEERLWERGFNQAELLAEAFECEEVLARQGIYAKQSKRDRRERMAALEGAFRLSEEGGRIDWCGKRVLIIDDIYTTGATLRAAASVFYEHGVSGVCAVTVARAIGSLKNKG